MPSESRPRRSVLAGAAALLSGCAAVPSGIGADASRRTRLGSVGIRNHDADAHTVDVVVERDGSVVHWTSREVAGKDGRTAGSAVVASGRFVDDPGRYVVLARLDDGTTGKRLDLAELDGGCYVVQVRIDADGSFSFATAEDAYECETGGTRTADDG